MQTEKEALLARLKGEKADFIPEVWSSHKNILFPGEIYMDFEHFDPHGTGPDAWGGSVDKYGTKSRGRWSYGCQRISDVR